MSRRSAAWAGRCAWVLSGAMVMFGASAAHAHGMRAGYLEIHEHAPGRAWARWSLSVAAEGVRPEFPSSCRIDDARGPSWVEPRSFALECTHALAGQRIAVEGLGPGLSEVVVWVSLADGSRASRLLSSDSASWELPRAPGSALEVGASYVRFGLLHILSGLDHLFFLLLLVLGLKRFGALVLAESAFTLSHGLSFSATALGWVTVSAVAAEVCIALSLVLAALDLERPGAGAQTMLGPLSALIFGLVHGLGFAGGLEEIGLPERDTSHALLGFAAGVEIGQLAFLIVAFGAVRWARRWRHFPKMALASTYVIGAVRAFWLIERMGSLVGGQ